MDEHFFDKRAFCEGKLSLLDLSLLDRFGVELGRFDILELNLVVVSCFWENETSGLEPFFLWEKVPFLVFLSVFETPLPNMYLPLADLPFLLIVNVLLTGFNLINWNTCLKRRVIIQKESRYNTSKRHLF